MSPPPPWAYDPTNPDQLAEPARFLRLAEAQMLDHEIDITRRSLELLKLGDEGRWGRAEVHQSRELAEARAAFRAFPCCDWWTRPRPGRQ